MSLFNELFALGLKMKVHGEELRVYPKGKIAPEVREYIRSNKAILIEEIKREQLEALRNYNGKSFSEKDPFLESGASIMVFFPLLGRDVWLCADENARSRVEVDGFTRLLSSDLRYILRGKPGEDRLNRLKRACARRHPITEEVLEAFCGKITKIRLRG